MVLLLSLDMRDNGEPLWVLEGGKVKLMLDVVSKGCGEGKRWKRLEEEQPRGG